MVECRRQSSNLTQHVLFPTRPHSHTLDLVITSISPTDHVPIICSLKITNSPTAPRTKHLTRAINITELCHDILFSCPTTHPPSTIYDLVDCYNSTLPQLLNILLSSFKSSAKKLRNPWYILALKKLKLAKSHIERIWSRTYSFDDLKNLRSATNQYHAAIIKAKRTYSSFISSSSTTSSTLEKNQ